jgi:tetratricopeptide (TPR) repeat protein
MRALRAISCFLLAVGTSIWGQSAVDEQIQGALLLEQKGQFPQALALLQPLASLQQLSAVQAGKIWTGLGYACQEEGDWARAGKSYEEAVRVLKEQPSGKADYATALDNLAGWYRATGDRGAAIKLERAALRLHQEADDHAGAAWTLVHLAVVELTRKRKSDAQQYLDAAEKEVSLTTSIGNDYRASLYSAEGWLAALEGNNLTAIFDYSQSLALQPCKDCMRAGWDYVILGKAYANDGQISAGLENMRKGLAILSDTVGQHSSMYLAAEIAYADVLDSEGEHAQSKELRNAAKFGLSSFRDPGIQSPPESFLVGH